MHPKAAYKYDYVKNILNLIPFSLFLKILHTRICVITDLRDIRSLKDLCILRTPVVSCITEKSYNEYVISSQQYI